MLTHVAPLAGRRLRVVEDEMLLAMDLEAILAEAGGDVLEPAAGQPDIASLDMNLIGESSAPIAAALREREIPSVVTGYSDKHSEDPMFRDVPVIKKP